MHTFLRNLTLLNFKNYEDVSLQFCDKINCFVGDNGIGKTNILDSIYYLSLCKSFFSGVDSLNIRHGHEFFVIQGEYAREDKTENIYCGVKQGFKKVFRRNNKEYDRLSEHIGLLPVVMVSPADSGLIIEGSEERRKFIDAVLSQFDHQYLDDLLRYNRVLTQRNLLLKDFARSNWFDADMVEMWDEQLVASGVRIFEKRKLFISNLIPVFQEYYEFVSGGKEKVELSYESRLLTGDFANMLKNSIEKDRKLQHTSVGIHKDDLLLSLSGFPIKRVGSQGQQKTFLVALKLAQFDYIKKEAGTFPLLLLDDIFDKFDAHRVAKIINLVASKNFGQIFITDTSSERMSEILKQIDGEYRLFHISEEGVNS
ncbi:MAG: DNA replication/repair protein RecF [Bacteroidota bacterium]|nr:DNA replication/repair protein RecF [Bacteroidota bacterium]